MFEIGNTLREARTRRGLTLKDAEDVTKVRSKYLQALENDDFEAIPGATFVKAFLRTYSEFLGLDPDTFVNEFKSRYEPDKQLHQPVLSRTGQRASPSRVRRRSNHVVVAIVALLILAVFWIWWSTRSEEPAVIGEGSLVATSTSPGQAASSNGGISSDGAASTSGSGYVKSGSILTVVVKAVREQCWVTVKKDSAQGATLFSGTLAKGEERVFSGGNRLWIRVGRPSALQLMVNGRIFPVPEPYGAFFVTQSGVERE